MAELQVSGQSYTESQMHAAGQAYLEVGRKMGQLESERDPVRRAAYLGYLLCVVIPEQKARIPDEVRRGLESAITGQQIREIFEAAIKQLRDSK